MANNAIPVGFSLPPQIGRGSNLQCTIHHFFQPLIMQSKALSTYRLPKQDYSHEKWIQCTKLESHITALGEINAQAADDLKCMWFTWEQCGWSFCAWLREVISGAKLDFFLRYKMILGSINSGLIAQHRLRRVIINSWRSGSPNVIYDVDANRQHE